MKRDNSPTISVIVPVYNVEAYLSTCIDSILAQTFQDFELILVDDGSTDMSGAICDDYAKEDPRVIVFHQNNQGQAAARNYALNWMTAHSDSSYVTFVDSDDWIHPQYLELLLAAISESDGISTSRIQPFHSMEEICIHHVDNQYTIKTPESIYTHDEKTVYAYVCGSLYSRCIWKTLRFPAGRRWEDLSIYHLALFQSPRIAWIDTPLYYYFQNSNGTSLSDWQPWKLDFIHAIKGLLQDPQIIERKQIHNVLISFYIKNCYRLLIRQSARSDGKETVSFLRANLRKGLLHFRNHPECSIRAHREYYDAAFPRLMLVFRITVEIKNKIIPFFHRNDNGSRDSR